MEVKVGVSSMEEIHFDLVNFCKGKSEAHP